MNEANITIQPKPTCLFPEEFTQDEILTIKNLRQVIKGGEEIRAPISASDFKTISKLKKGQLTDISTNEIETIVNLRESNLNGKTLTTEQLNNIEPNKTISCFC